MKLQACLALVLLVSRAQASCLPGRTGDRPCKPCRDGTYALNGDCVSCPAQAMCMSMPTSCQRMPPCNKATGEPTSMCWVDKPEGAACRPELYGDQPVPLPVTHVCRSGDCVEVTSKDCPSTPRCRRARGPCEVAPTCNKHGRPLSHCWVSARDGTACNPTKGGATPLAGYFCQKKRCINTAPVTPPASSCPDTPLCKRLGTVCETAPPCDADGRPTEMCWVEKPAGSGCTEGGKLGFCSDRDCVVSAGVLNPGEGKCPITPACRRMGGVCEQAPLCDASGKPAGMCWVPKADGAACAQDGTNGTCKRGACVV